MKKNMMKQMKGDKWPAFSRGFIVVTTSLLFPTMLCVGGLFSKLINKLYCERACQISAHWNITKIFVILSLFLTVP